MQGDPDRPVIVGRVYNAQHPPPYDASKDPTRSTVHSRSAEQKKELEGFNEIRFEDRASKEEIYLHAQRDLNEVVLASHTTSVGGDQSAWEGVSVTAHGTVACPAAPPFVTHVVLAVGAVEERLEVFGPRVWTRAAPGDALRPGEAKRYGRVALGWGLAFGGGYELPPGTVPGTDLPHPGGRIVYALNEEGLGFYPDEGRALGQGLPRIERADALVRRWDDRPEPGGLTPCPDHAALRLFHLAMSRVANPPAAPPEPGQPDLDAVLLMPHHAPPRLVLRRVPAGTPVSLDGLDGGPIRFEVPESPIVVRAEEGADPVPPRLRCLHVDAQAEGAAVGELARAIAEMGIRMGEEDDDLGVDMAYPRNGAGRGFFVGEDPARMLGSLAPNLDDASDPVEAGRMMAGDALAWFDLPVAACYEPLDPMTFPRSVFGLQPDASPPRRAVHELALGALAAEDLQRRSLFAPPLPRFHNAAPAGLAVCGCSAGSGCSSGTCTSGMRCWSSICPGTCPS